jgi:ribosome maturation factor RimP
MIFHKDSKSKDLDSWIGRPVKVVLNSESSFYIGVLVEEMKNGLLINSSGKHVYLPYESILVLEEL